MLRVPQNAVLLVVPDSLASVDGVTLDGVRVMPSQYAARRPFIAHPRLTPGGHWLQIDIDPTDATSFDRSQLEVDIELEVEPVVAPPPDETASARITRAVYFEQTQHQGLLGGYREAKRRALEEPLDCSSMVADQTWADTRCLIGGRPIPGDLRVEIEAEGDPIALSINGFIMPSHCRSTFLPSDMRNLEIQAVTATGLGSAQVFAGEIEHYVAPAVPSSAAGLEGGPGPMWTCALWRRPDTSSPGEALALVTLLGAAVARRLRRR